MKLGTWVHTQRIQYRKLLSGAAKKGAPLEDFEGESEKTEDEKNFRLTEDRRRRLDEVGFVWSAREIDKATEPVKVSRNSYDDQWDFMFERLREYKEQHGVSGLLIELSISYVQNLLTFVSIMFTRRIVLSQSATSLIRNLVLGSIRSVFSARRC